MSVAVGLGLMEFPFAGVDGYWRWVDLCEAGGVDSLWQTDRLVSREPILECMTVMAALAGRTRRIKFGMNVVSLALRDPVLVAKQCATIDVLSRGPPAARLRHRQPAGAGMGGAAPRHARRAGARPTRGWRSSRRLWREDSVDFEGEHYHLTGASISPKPVQPDLPMWIGGSSEAAIRRTARVGTGWQGGPETPAEAARRSSPPSRPPPPRPAAASTTTTTAPASPSISAGRRAGAAAGDGGLPKRTGRDANGYFAIGDAGVIVERIADYVAAGVSKFILRPWARAATR